MTAAEILASVNQLITDAERDLNRKLYLIALREAEHALEMLSALKATLPVVIKASTDLATAQGNYIEEDGMPTRAEVFARQQAQLTESYEAIKKGQYDTAQKIAADLSRIIGAMLVAVASLRTVIASHMERRKTIAGILASGFRLQELASSRQSVFMATRNSARQALVTGNFKDAQALAKQLEEQSLRQLTEIQAVPALQAKNTAELARLSQEVARVQAMAANALASWQVLQKYAPSNWKPVANNYDTATTTLNRLFYNPAHANDLASVIAGQNSMKSQEFDGATKALELAFAEVKTAEGQLRAISSQLTLVQAAEASIDVYVARAEKKLKEAVTLRDAQNQKVDTDVDRLIAIATKGINLAKELRQKDEFLLASQEANDVLATASKALAKASDQVSNIDTLVAAINAAKSEAERAVGKASSMLADMKPAVRNAATAGMVANAEDLLKAAKVAEQKAQRLEDLALAEALQQATDGYNKARQLGLQATKKLTADQDTYDRSLRDVKAAIDQAQAAISEAAGYVGHEDSGDAGGYALRRARSSLPSVPQYGSARSSLQSALNAAEEARRAAEEASKEAQSSIEDAEDARRRARVAAERRRQEQEQNESRSTTYGSTRETHDSYRPSRDDSSDSRSSRDDAPSFSPSRQDPAPSFGGTREG